MNQIQSIPFAETMKEKLIAPELEVFDLGTASHINVLKKRNLLPHKCYAKIILGNICGGKNSLFNISPIIANVPDGVTISFGGIGDYQTKTIMHGLASGHGVMVGLEDNVWYDVNRTILASNSTLFKRVVHIAEILDLQPAKPLEICATLGFASGYGEYGLIQLY